MCRPAATRTLQPGGTNTSSVWIGLRRGGSTLRIAIRGGFAGGESARTSVRRSLRSNRSAARFGDWLVLQENCGERKSICATWMWAGGWGRSEERRVGEEGG